MFHSGIKTTELDEDDRFLRVWLVCVCLHFRDSIECRKSLCLIRYTVGKWNNDRKVKAIKKSGWIE